VKVGDFTGWADTWSDEEGCRPAGIILDVKENDSFLDDEGWMPADGGAQYLILYQHNGVLAWEYGSDLVVMFEGR